MSKYLINSDHKAIRRGEYVEATSDGEFILDTETMEDNKDLTVSALHKIAEANNIKAPKNSSRADLIENITTNLEKSKMPEQNHPTQSNIIKGIVEEEGEHRDADTDSDEFEVAVFTRCIEKLNELGITFKIKQLGSLVKREIAEQGLVVTNTQRKEMVFDILESGGFNPETWDDVQQVIEHIVAEVNDTDHKQALSAIRKYAKVNEIELPKRSTRKKSSGSFRSQAIQFMIENSPCSDETLMEFVVEADRADPEKVVARLSKLRDTIDEAVAFGRANPADSEETAEAA